MQRTRGPSREVTVKKEGLKVRARPGYYLAAGPES